MKNKQKMTTQLPLFTAMVVLFFIWGFITLFNDLLIPVLKSKLHLSYGEAMLVQFCFFLTYFVMSLPMAWLLNKLDYKKSIIVGLLIIAIGCLIFIPADLKRMYAVFLLGLFILATGVVMLQVSANPLVTLLGATETSPARLTLAQGINSLGYVIAPILVGGLIVSVHLYIPYVVIAFVMLLVVVFIGRFNFHFVEAPLKNVDHEATIKFSLWDNIPFLLGFISIFFYVGAEVASGSLIISFLHLPSIANFSLAHAAKYLSVYWAGAMMGRLIGSYLLTKISSAKALIVCAMANVILLCGVVLTTGDTAMWSLLLLGVFNSIMFPTIFALAISSLPSEGIKNKASGFLVMAIVGGAVIPELQGLLADFIGLQYSFVLLFASYLTIITYAIYIHFSIAHNKRLQ